MRTGLRPWRGPCGWSLQSQCLETPWALGLESDFPKTKPGIETGLGGGGAPGAAALCGTPSPQSALRGWGSRMGNDKRLSCVRPLLRWFMERVAGSSCPRRQTPGAECTALGGALGWWARS